MGSCSGTRIAIALVTMLVMIIIYLCIIFFVDLFYGSTLTNVIGWSLGIGGLVFMGYVTYLIGYSCDPAEKHQAQKV